MVARCRGGKHCRGALSRRVRCIDEEAIGPAPLFQSCWARIVPNAGLFARALTDLHRDTCGDDLWRDSLSAVEQVLPEHPATVCRLRVRGAAARHGGLRRSRPRGVRRRPTHRWRTLRFNAAGLHAH